MAQKYPGDIQPLSTFWSVLCLTIATASLMLSFSCWRCHFWSCRWSYPHNPIGKRSSGVTSGDVGGQATHVPFLTHLPNVWWKCFLMTFCSEAIHHLVVRQFHMVTGELHTIPACPCTSPRSWLVQQERRIWWPCHAISHTTHSVWYSLSPNHTWHVDIYFPKSWNFEESHSTHKKGHLIWAAHTEVQYCLDISCTARDASTEVY